jgi:predicted amidophosphoribosyltransferase
LVLIVGVYVGGLLIAVGVYVRLESMSNAPTVPVARLCPQCGKSNLPTNKFCDKCGAKFSVEGP